jgi:hypothetical protein
MDFRNTTELDSGRLYDLLLRHTHPYRHDGLRVRVRYSRSAAFSGRCFYRDPRIYVNLGRRNRYPYAVGTHIARARCSRTRWWRETYRLIVADAYQLVLFVYLHELYHHLVKVAGRNHRRKESMCDRFATRVLVDCHGCVVVDRGGLPVLRNLWDFKDLTRFVAAAPREAPLSEAAATWAPNAIPRSATAQERPIPVIIRGRTA